jgi:hypothetical protein
VHLKSGWKRGVAFGGKVYSIQNYVIKLDSDLRQDWFSPGAPVSSTNKTDHHGITEILLKVVLNIINCRIKAISSDWNLLVCTYLTEAIFKLTLISYSLWSPGSGRPYLKFINVIRFFFSPYSKISLLFQRIWKYYVNIRLASSLLVEASDQDIQFLDHRTEAYYGWIYNYQCNQCLSLLTL